MSCHILVSPCFSVTSSLLAWMRPQATIQTYKTRLRSGRVCTPQSYAQRQTDFCDCFQILYLNRGILYAQVLLSFHSAKRVDGWEDGLYSSLLRKSACGTQSMPFKLERQARHESSLPFQAAMPSHIKAAFVNMIPS